MYLLVPFPFPPFWAGYVSPVFSILFSRHRIDFCHYVGFLADENQENKKMNTGKCASTPLPEPKKAAVNIRGTL